MRRALIFSVCAQTRRCGSVACACKQEFPPPVTRIDKSKTSSSKRVADNITFAAARAPAKKVAPSASAPDVAPVPVGFSRQSLGDGGSKGKDPSICPCSWHPFGDCGVADELLGLLVRGAQAVWG